MRTLLVAEDSVRAARISMLLEEHGHDVFHAASVSEALEALEMQKFEFVLRDSTPGRALNREALDRFHEIFQSEDRPRLAIVREDATAPEPFHLAHPCEPGVDAVIEGHFSPFLLAELVSELVHRPAPHPDSVSSPIGAGLPVFERDQFERQMNYDRDLIVEIIRLFISETNQQIAELQSCIDAGLDVPAKRLAHTLKGSFGAVYALQAGALAREMEVAATQDFPSLNRIMPGLRQATAEIQHTLLDLIAE